MLQPDREKIARARELYLQLGTLAAAGQQMDLTRERVRQLIKKGVGLGMFEAPPKVGLDISKEQLLNAVKLYGSMAAAAQASGIAITTLDRRRKQLGVSTEDIAAALIQVRRQTCIDDFLAIANTIGHYPTTTELEFKIAGGRALYARIARNWPSFAAFRRSLGVAPPRAGNPNIRKDTAAGREQRSTLARIRRRQVEEQILERLRIAGPALRSELRDLSNVGEIYINSVLRQLEHLDAVTVDRTEKPFVYRLREE
jgi:hypothetical protein